MEGLGTRRRTTSPGNTCHIQRKIRDLSWIQILTNLTNLPNGDKLTLYHYISRLYYPSLFAYWLTQEAHKHELSMFFMRLGGMEINHQLRVFSI